MPESPPVIITAEERVELRCGKATILMEKDGRITIRSTAMPAPPTASAAARST
jgi:hypothetical protein